MSQIAALALGGVIGATAGSFLATILIRWPQGLAVSQGRSRCDGCAAPLGAASLVPIISFLVRKGRCCNCGAAIPRDHLTIELLAAAIGGISAGLFAAMPLLALATALFGWMLLLLAALDWRHFWLPDLLTLPLGALGLAVSVSGIGPEPMAALIGVASGYAGLTLIGWTYRAMRGRDGLGGGDPKLLGAIGAWLGWQALPWVLTAAAGIGLVLALAASVSGRTPGLATKLPLGALLALAAWPLWVALRQT